MNKSPKCWHHETCILNTKCDECAEYQDFFIEANSGHMSPDEYERRVLSNHVGVSEKFGRYMATTITTTTVLGNG